MNATKRLCCAVAVLCCVASGAVRAQLADVVVWPFDSIAPNSFRGEVGLLIKLSQEERDQKEDFILVSTLKARYLSRQHDYTLSLRGNFENDDGGAITRESFIVAGVGLCKYGTAADGSWGRRAVYAQPVVFFSNNTDRGIAYRMQGGALFHPYFYAGKKVCFDLGVGATYSFTRWEVFDQGKYDELTDDERARIDWVNASEGTIDGRFRDAQNINATLFAELEYSPLPNFRLAWTNYLQMGLLKTYSSAVTDRYPELGVRYPHWVWLVDLEAVVYKGLSLSLTCTGDYERSAQSLYCSTWEYRLLAGIKWHFTAAKR